jgi:hypothetical protein
MFHLFTYGYTRGITDGDGTVTATGAGDLTYQTWALPGGISLGEMMDLTARTSDGVVYCAPDSTNEFTAKFGTRDGANAVAYTITLEQDDHIPAGSLELASSFEDRPSRVSVSFPGGDALLVDDVAEAAGVYQEATLTTSAWSEADSLTAAGRLLARGAPALWVRRIALDLATSVANLWAMPNALIPGVSRVRVAGLPASHFGRTSADYVVEGWSCSFGTERAYIVLELSPAPVVAVLSSSDAADRTPRIGATATLSTALPNGTGTTVVIATTGPAFTTAGGSYPMVVTIDGEDISLASAPGGSTSPQTFTGCTRGVSPTQAGSHAAGTAVKIRDSIIL